MMPISAFSKMFGGRRGVQLQVKVADKLKMTPPG